MLVCVVHTVWVSGFFVVGVCIWIPKPIEAFYENCLSFMFACQHLIQYWCRVCWMPFYVFARLVLSCLVSSSCSTIYSLLLHSQIRICLSVENHLASLFQLYLILLTWWDLFCLFSLLIFGFLCAATKATHYYAYTQSAQLTTFQSHFQAELFMWKL